MCTAQSSFFAFSLSTVYRQCLNISSNKKNEFTMKVIILIFMVLLPIRTLPSTIYIFFFNHHQNNLPHLFLQPYFFRHFETKIKMNKTIFSSHSPFAPFCHRHFIPYSTIMKNGWDLNILYIWGEEVTMRYS